MDKCRTSKVLGTNSADTVLEHFSTLEDADLCPACALEGAIVKLMFSLYCSYALGEPSGNIATGKEEGKRKLVQLMKLAMEVGDIAIARDTKERKASPMDVVKMFDDIDKLLKDAVKGGKF
jgi:hypothetical protein|tara:strand:- start:28 stop:390 length:363 start_codon:yes stop_codon:yes gene_type:complete